MPSAQQPPKPAQAIWSQMQAPLKQASPIIGSQLSQGTPPVPQVASVLGWQASSASQQPLVQLVGVHRHSPARHSWPAGQMRPQAPQLLLSPLRSTHWLAQRFWPSGQPALP